MNLSNWVGKRVTWERIKEMSKPSMYDHKGFGSFDRSELGGRLVISGDYGVWTSEVTNVKETDEGLEVTTQNSVYLIKAY